MLKYSTAIQKDVKEYLMIMENTQHVDQFSICIQKNLNKYVYKSSPHFTFISFYEVSKSQNIQFSKVEHSKPKSIQD